MKSLAAILLLFSASACTQVVSTSAVAPAGSQSSASGATAGKKSINIQPFEYAGVEGDKRRLKFTIERTKILLDKPVGEYVAGNLATYLAGNGYRTDKNAKCTISGRVNNLEIDNWGFKMAYRAEISYKISSKDLKNSFSVFIKSKSKNFNPFVTHHEGLSAALANSFTQLSASAGFNESLQRCHTN